MHVHISQNHTLSSDVDKLEKSFLIIHTYTSYFLQNINAHAGTIMCEKSAFSQHDIITNQLTITMKNTDLFLQSSCQHEYLT